MLSLLHKKRKLASAENLAMTGFSEQCHNIDKVNRQVFSCQEVSKRRAGITNLCCRFPLKSKSARINRFAQRQSLRSEGGVQLVELVVAIGLISLLTASLLDGLWTCARTNTATQNQLAATNIAQQVVDQVRNANWNTLKNNLGTRSLLVNRSYGGQTGPGFQPRPLMLDMANNSYSEEGKNNLFQGTVTETIADIGQGQLLVTVNVKWADEQGRKQKELNMSTLVSQDGIHN